MLIPFDGLFKKYNVNAKGVIHIGASTGQEIEHYYDNGIERSIWIEAIPSVFEQLKENIKPYPNAYAICACISDKHGGIVDFGVSNNEAQSSSFLPLGTHKIAHPSVVYVETLKLKTERMDQLLKKQYRIPDKPDFILDHFKIIENALEYTFLNIDLQGAELFALRGMGGMLNDINYAYLEVNKEELYVGCALIEEIDDYLTKYDLQRVETHWAGNTGWGDAFYVRKTLL